MSRFIGIMLSLGLIESPPVSNVMPLPTSTTCGALATPLSRGVVESDEPRRVGGALADPDDAAEAFRGELALVPHRRPSARAAWRRRRPARPAMRGSSRWPAPAPACGTSSQRRRPRARGRARVCGLRRRRARRARPVRPAGPAARWSASGTRRTRAPAPRRGPAARRRRRGRPARWRPWSGPWCAGRRRRRLGAGRRGRRHPRRPAAPGVSAGLASRRRIEHRPLDDLAGLAGGAVQLEQSEQVLAELVEQLGGTRTQRRAHVAGQHGDRDGLGTDDGGRGHVAERDLGRADLAGKGHDRCS